eukprot:Gregarina_sp_Poly_1__10962@NODE_863_length_5938_cov_134_668029_g624_i0_p1_GENE_NODE_863_length_5938_cov_134_668029_g624_i0NODE_863_length_5938_cov_134_668029_g624_i0_p1_ORF_typecomplete_len1211_score164_16Sec23_trunk/PF04811_15/9_8e25Sec23_helical/PF04815_15/5_9e16Sec23_BS/PF08033_12/2_2e12zfSec23_Sec24/PF04810_15/1_3e05Gelsolin/PF00626_22/0_0091_NODE_863_length_5938_cov_134_668029_g624_i020185650
MPSGYPLYASSQTPVPVPDTTKRGNMYQQYLPMGHAGQRSGVPVETSEAASASMTQPYYAQSGDPLGYNAHYTQPQSYYAQGETYEFAQRPQSYPSPTDFNQAASALYASSEQAMYMDSQGPDNVCGTYPNIAAGAYPQMQPNIAKCAYSQDVPAAALHSNPVSESQAGYSQSIQNAQSVQNVQAVQSSQSVQDSQSLPNYMHQNNQFTSGAQMRTKPAAPAPKARYTQSPYTQSPYTQPQPQPPPQSLADKAVTTLAKNTDNRIDVQQIPRPAYKETPSEPGGRRVEADHPGAPPPSTAFCTYVEDVDATPRYIRSSLILVPQSRQTFNTSKIPFYIIASPFPTLPTFECRPPCVDLSPFSPLFTHLVAPQWNYNDKQMFERRPGPPRCSGCASYVNPHWQFSTRHAVCAMCSKNFELPDFYSNALQEHRGIVHPEAEAEFRKSLKANYDLNQANTIFSQNLWCRPELLRGTVDFVTHSHPHRRLRPDANAGSQDAFTQAAAAILQAASPSRPPSNPAVEKLPYQGAGFSVQTGDSNGLFLDPNAGNPPHAPPALVYLVDISAPALASGFTRSALASIRATLSKWPRTTVEIAILLFNDAVHFAPVYRKRRDNEPDSRRLHQLYMVKDVNNPFIPASAQSLFLPVEVGQEVEPEELTRYCEGFEFLIDLEARNLGAVPSSNCCIAAVCAGIELLVARETETSSPSRPVRGGCICLFTTSHSTIGIGSYTANATSVVTMPKKSATRASVSSKEKPSNVYVPRKELKGTYSEIYRHCCTHAIAVQAFCAGARDRKIDLGCLGYLPLYTGGQTYFYPQFSVFEYHDQMYYDLLRLFMFPVAFDCNFKIRLSKGLTVTRILCPWSCIEWESGGAGRDASTFMVPFMGPDTTVCFEISYTESQLDSNQVIIQTACTYTSWTGQRRLRVSTKKHGVSNSLMTAFRHADVEPVFVGWSRQMFLAAIGENPKMRESLSRSLTDMLFSYRINAAINSPTGQLILPESLKLLPVYLTGLYKSKALRVYAREEERAASLFNLLSASPAKLALGLYPLVFPLHRSYTDYPRENLARMGLPTDIEDFVYVPASVPSSGERITTDGIFLMDNGEVFYLYIGKDVKSTAIAEIIPSNVDGSNTQFFPEQQEPGSLGQRIQAVIHQLRRQKFNQAYQGIRLIKAGNLLESEFIWHLVEDRLGSEKGYVDYLCQLHRTVQQLMDES